MTPAETFLKWTGEVPKEDGFYWWRMGPDCDPEIVLVDNAGDAVQVMGTDVRMWLVQMGDMEPTIDGEFWPVKLTPP